MKQNTINWATLFMLITTMFFGRCVQAGIAEEESNDDTVNFLALAAYANSLNLSLTGSFNFFNGTDGTTSQGTYVVSQSGYSQQFGSFTPTTGDIVSYDNSQKVFYYKQTSTGANLGKFIWVRWTINSADSKIYVCPDLSGAATTLADSQTEFATVLANSSGIADPTNLGVDGVFSGQGCSGVFWSRLENQ